MSQGSFPCMLHSNFIKEHLAENLRIDFPGFGSALEKLGYVESFIYLADFFQNFTLLSWMIFFYPSPKSPILFTYLIAYFIWKICV